VKRMETLAELVPQMMPYYEDKSRVRRIPCGSP